MFQWEDNWAHWDKKVDNIWLNWYRVKRLNEYRYVNEDGLRFWEERVKRNEEQRKIKQMTEEQRREYNRKQDDQRREEQRREEQRREEQRREYNKRQDDQITDSEIKLAQEISRKEYEVLEQKMLEEQILEQNRIEKEKNQDEYKRKKGEEELREIQEQARISAIIYEEKIDVFKNDAQLNKQYISDQIKIEKQIQENQKAAELGNQARLQRSWEQDSKNQQSEEIKRSEIEQRKVIFGSNNKNISK